LLSNDSVLDASQVLGDPGCLAKGVINFLQVR
jgi:hypothetical protein